MFIPIEDVRTAPDQPLDPALVDHYVAALRRGEAIPPIQVCQGRKGYTLLDGVAQVNAARLAGISQLPGELVTRTNADKREHVAQLLSDPTYQVHSDRSIARRCQVDDKFVGRVRRELQLPEGQERLVRRGNQVFRQHPRHASAQPNDSIALHLHDEPYSQVELPAGYADIILSVVPDGADVSIADLAPRMAAHLNATGIACLIFNPFQALWLSDWLRALKDAGLLYRKMLCWHITGLEPGRYRDAFSDFELILVVGRRSIGGPAHPVIRGPHTPGVNHPNMQYQKPLWLILKLLELVKQPRGSVLLDPLVESGVTLLGARAYGMAEATGCLLSARSRKQVEEALNSDEIMPSVGARKPNRDSENGL